TIYNKVLPDELLPQLYKYAKDHSFAILSYDNEVVVTEHPNDKYVEYESFLTKMEVRGVDNFLESVSRPVPKCLIVGDAEPLALLEKKMQSEIGDLMNIYRSEAFFLELVPLNIDKAESLARLLNHIGMNKEEMIAVGDGYNDLSMIQFAGMGIAMENAKPEVKEAANFITSSNDEDGVAAVIEKFILN
ncbi:MAG: Cof-type HAD-IIB family hydrolase, partial [Bacteroidales bacterium]